MMLVFCSNWSVRGIPNVKDSSSIGMEELLLQASVICVMRDNLCMAWEAEWVAPWTKLLRATHWLQVYSLNVRMIVLVHWEGLKLLLGTLYIMKVDIAAPQCRQRCPHNACNHPIKDCLVQARKIDWSMGSLSEGIGKGHCGLGSPSCHDLIPYSMASQMGLGV